MIKSSLRNWVKKSKKLESATEIVYIVTFVSEFISNWGYFDYIPFYLWKLESWKIEIIGKNIIMSILPGLLLICFCLIL